MEKTESKNIEHGRSEFEMKAKASHQKKNILQGVIHESEERFSILFSQHFVFHDDLIAKSRVIRKIYSVP
jgi:hypothetical protein